MIIRLADLGIKRPHDEFKKKEPNYSETQFRFQPIETNKIQNSDFFFTQLEFLKMVGNFVFIHFTLYEYYLKCRIEVWHSPRIFVMDHFWHF